MSGRVSGRSTPTYLITVVLLLLAFPAASVLADAFLGGRSTDLMFGIGKWFVFWAAGVRLFLAGIRQIFKLEITARDIFELKDPGALAVVRELGFANASMGALALASAANGAWVIPGALVGGLYCGLAGAGHFLRQRRNAIEQIALVSDLLIFALLAVFLASRIAQ